MFFKKIVIFAGAKNKTYVLNRIKLTVFDLC